MQRVCAAMAAAPLPRRPCDRVFQGWRRCLRTALRLEGPSLVAFASLGRVFFAVLSEVGGGVQGGGVRR
eukprot:11199974-Lingulodinium_polyedra.AAC.1